ncbi:MAG: winged helix-turn-helix domain-containing protein [Candidatus Sulfotelmatobacter sp.]
MEPNGQNSNGHNSTTRFGVFELDKRSGELRKFGTRIRLQDQPLKVLMALLEQPGAVVTRDELKRKIWPDESFGDFDHAVNVAVAKLRAALADSADTPRFVETLHRRGYRFIFPVGSPSVDSTAQAQVAAAAGNRVGLKAAEKSARFPTAAVLGSAVVALALLASTWWFSHHGAHKLTEKDTVVLADFMNSTGDPVFDGTLRQGLAVQLSQSPFLILISEERVKQPFS